VDPKEEDSAEDEEPSKIHSIDGQSFLDEESDLILDQARESLMSLLLLEPSAELAELIGRNEDRDPHDPQEKTDMAEIGQERDRISEMITEESELLQSDLEGISQRKGRFHAESVSHDSTAIALPRFLNGQERLPDCQLEDQVAGKSPCARINEGQRILAGELICHELDALPRELVPRWISGYGLIQRPPREKMRAPRCHAPVLIRRDQPIHARQPAKVDLFFKDLLEDHRCPKGTDRAACSHEL